MFWVSTCIVLGISTKDTLIESQLNSNGAWGSNMAFCNDFSEHVKLFAEIREIAALVNWRTERLWLLLEINTLALVDMKSL